jgi:UTP--glucose-1-phosphate uridylyltransferase
MKIRKAVITCAGFGTRFLPISKTIQKEMLPILDRPLIDYVVDDCIKAGIEEIIFVINEHNYQVLHYYRENKRLYDYLEKMGKLDRYEEIKDIHQKAKFHFVKQSDQDQYGTAVPVLLAKEYIKDEDAFLVLMGDDFIYNADGSSEAKRMIETFEKSGSKGLVTCIEKPEELLNKYGIAELKEENGYAYLQNLVEKPEPGKAPSNLANISKYIMTPEILEIIENQEVNPQSGELYITDSVTRLAEKDKVVVHKPAGEYLDGGYPLGWLLTNLTVAKNNPEIWKVIKEFVEKS